MKKLLIAIAAILILAGGAVAAMKWLQIGPFASTEMATEAKEEPEEDSGFLGLPGFEMATMLLAMLSAAFVIRRKKYG